MTFELKIQSLLYLKMMNYNYNTTNYT